MGFSFGWRDVLEYAPRCPARLKITMKNHNFFAPFLPGHAFLCQGQSVLLTSWDADRSFSSLALEGL